MMSNIKTRSMESTVFNKLLIDQIVDTAVSDAVSSMVEGIHNNRVIINKDKAIESLYNTLFINFNVMQDKVAQRRILGYLPIIIVVDYDGFYSLVHDEYIGEDGYRRIEPIWQPKMSYAYSDGTYVYSFTLDHYLSVYDINSGQFYVGLQEELKEEISSDIIQDNKTFDEVRRRTIINAIEKKMVCGINEHNQIASQYGITYKFSLPVIEKEDWYRTIDDSGMIVFFQGIPLSMDGEYYNSFALGGAMVTKTSNYYIQEDKDSGISYYHREGCSELTNSSIVMTSREKCAISGAYPCDTCKP